MADSSDKMGQAGQGTIDMVKPASQISEEAKQDASKEKESPPSCGPSGCSVEQLKEQEKSKSG
jgi:hypothetical protein